MNDQPSDPLGEALVHDVRAAWQALQALRPGDTFYAFGIHTTDVAALPSVVACTEEDLADFGDEGDPAVIALKRRCYRWSLADSSLFEAGEAMLPRTQAIRASQPDPFLCDDDAVVDRDIDAFFATAFDVLRELDQEGLFGRGAAREQLILSIWLHDESHESRVRSAARLNAAAAVERYRRELDDGLVAHEEHRGMKRERGASRA